jgi:uncharacterized protein YjgD (DUF1641 family)
MIEKATHQLIREAVVAAMDGESSMLEASAEFPLEEAKRFATTVISEREPPVLENARPSPGSAVARGSGTAGYRSMRFVPVRAVQD